jgi:integrase
MLHSSKITQKNSSGRTQRGSTPSSAAKTAQKSQKTRQKRISDEFYIYDNEVFIFRTTQSGDVWQMRMWIAGEKKYVRESLRTRDKSIAIEEAKRRFLNYHNMVKTGQKIFSVSVAEMREKYLDHISELVRAGQISKGRETNIKTFTRRCEEFLGKDTKIGNVDKKHFQDYRAFRQKRLKTITMTVVRNESITIKQMYKWAANEGFIPSTYLPDFGVIRVPKQETVRDGYTIKEYKQLTNYASKWYQKVGKTDLAREEKIYYRKSVRDFILLMSNFGFRTGELLQVQYKHIEFKRDGVCYILIPAENTKVRKARLTGGKKADLIKRKMEYSKYKEPEDFLFSKFHKAEMMTKTLLYDYFSELITAVKSECPDFDNSKTLYSLRHFFITWHLTIGKSNVYDIAKIAGTSLKQIQDHYDHVIQSHKIDELISHGSKSRIDDDYQLVMIEGDSGINGSEDGESG